MTQHSNKLTSSSQVVSNLLKFSYGVQEHAFNSCTRTRVNYKGVTKKIKSYQKFVPACLLVF